MHLSHKIWIMSSWDLCEMCPRNKSMARVESGCRNSIYGSGTWFNGNHIIRQPYTWSGRVNEMSVAYVNLYTFQSDTCESNQYIVELYQHAETRTKRSLFCRPYFDLCVLEWNLLNCDSYWQFVLKGPAGNTIHWSLQWCHNRGDGVWNHQPHDLFTQAFIQAQFKENIKAVHHWPLWGEFTGDRWIPRTKGQ